VEVSDDESSESGRQSSFTTPVQRSKEILKRAAKLHSDHDRVMLAVSGGTDSIVAADIVARYGPEYGIKPDTVVHINTGTGIPQTRLVAKVFAEVHGLEYHEQGYRREQDSIAHRVLNNGWPGGYGGSPMTGGHGLEWANRKDKPMDQVYVDYDGLQIWTSGARDLESARRSANMVNGAIDKDRPRRIWVSPIYGWTPEDKVEYLMEQGLPVSVAYLGLGFSGECTPCAFDDAGVLNDLEGLAPELAYAVRSLSVWLYQRVRRGDVEIEPKRLCWGWEVEEDDEVDTDGQQRLDGTEACPVSQTKTGCDTETCGEREMPEWVRDLPWWQIVDRTDVEAAWDGQLPKVAARFGHVKPSVDATSPAVARTDGGRPDE
jgi:3'-phosphoadenosine 5'-phosphosulfate sulfotransferase (PAPS reductase)/FAD synthetase